MRRVVVWLGAAALASLCAGFAFADKSGKGLPLLSASAKPPQRLASAAAPSHTTTLRIPRPPSELELARGG